MKKHEAGNRRGYGRDGPVRDADNPIATVAANLQGDPLWTPARFTLGAS
jgi:hypothetical protein